MDPTILVVDDEPAICTLLHRVLTRAGYRIQEANDGLLALEMVAIERPALVLTDLMMPRMKGDELVARLMQQPDPIPCILMSAFHSHPPIATVPFLAKPFTMAGVMELVAENLR